MTILIFGSTIPLIKLNNVNKRQLTVNGKVFKTFYYLHNLHHILFCSPCKCVWPNSHEHNLALIIKILLKDLLQIITLFLGINCSLLSYNDSRSFN